MIPKIAMVLACLCVAWADVDFEPLSNDANFLDVIKSRSVRSTCGYDSCNSFCRKLGHARGVCIGTYCQCRSRRRRSLPVAQDAGNVNKKEIEEANKIPQPDLKEQSTNGVSILADAVLSRKRRSCGAGECNQFCKKLGHARGVCIGTYCQCRTRLRRSLFKTDESENVNDVQTKEVNKIPQLSVKDNSELSAVSNLADVVLSRRRRSCGAGECNLHCRKLGHVRGVCIGTYCQCRSQ